MGIAAAHRPIQPFGRRQNKDRLVRYLRACFAGLHSAPCPLHSTPTMGEPSLQRLQQGSTGQETFKNRPDQTQTRPDPDPDPDSQTRPLLQYFYSLHVPGCNNVANKPHDVKKKKKLCPRGLLIVAAAAAAVVAATRDESKREPSGNPSWRLPPSKG